MLIVTANEISQIASQATGASTSGIERSRGCLRGNVPQGAAGEQASRLLEILSLDPAWIRESTG